MWDIVRVPFPYTDRPVEQRRPALVIAVVDEEAMPKLLWALMITSATHRRWPGDIVITNDAVAHLPVPSIVRTFKIATIEASSAEHLGVLPRPDRAAVAERLLTVLSRAR